MKRRRTAGRWRRQIKRIRMSRKKEKIERKMILRSKLR
jgi:hypothetical protein